ncbi:MAG: WxcM-like domain-containing protein [Solobacterium sp.]|nr:WxcM-like domain-containing protein [Solobacterium sp.]
MSYYRLLEFHELGDERGNLVAIEGNQDIPFEIRRVFYLYGTDDSMVRGQHANRHSQFVLINVSGSSDIRIRDGKGNEEIVHLNKPRMGVYLPAMIWKEMYNFSKNSVILCLSDTHYDGSEYIRDYDEYVRIVNGTEQGECRE